MKAHLLSRVLRALFLVMIGFITVGILPNLTGQTQQNGQFITVGIHADIDDVRYNVVFSDIPPKELPKQLRERSNSPLRLATPEELQAFFAKVKNVPETWKGMKRYVVRSVLPPKSQLVFSSPSKFIGETFYMFAYSKLDNEKLVEALGLQVPAAWRLADDTEAENFLKALAGKPSFIEEKQPASIEGMKRYVVARIKSRPPGFENVVVLKE